MLSYVCLSARRDNVGGRSGQRWFTRLHHQTFIARTTELRAAEIRKAERGLGKTEAIGQSLRGIRSSLSVYCEIRGCRGLIFDWQPNRTSLGRFRSRIAIALGPC